MSTEQAGVELWFDQINDRIRDALITGTAITIPLIVTLIVFGFVLRAVSNILKPFVTGINLLLGFEVVPNAVLQVFTLVLLFWFVLGVGFVANTREQRRPRDGQLTQTVNDLLSNIPGFGSVYTGVRQMSEVVLSSDTESFRAVKVVEFPHMDSFMLCFLTASPPEGMREAVGHPEMQTVFVPLAPNPVMGGFLTFVPRDRIYDIDISVEEGMRAIMTSGVAIDPRTSPTGTTPPKAELPGDFNGDDG